MRVIFDLPRLLILAPRGSLDFLFFFLNFQDFKNFGHAYKSFIIMHDIIVFEFTFRKRERIIFTYKQTIFLLFLAFVQMLFRNIYKFSWRIAADNERRG